MGCGTWTLIECIKGIHKVRKATGKPKFGDKGCELRKEAAKKVHYQNSENHQFLWLSEYISS